MANQPPHPFSHFSILNSYPGIRKTFKLRDQVQGLVTSLQTTRPGILGTTLADRRAWWHKAKLVRQQIETERDRLQIEDADFRIAAEELLQDIADINEDTQQACDDAKEMDREQLKLDASKLDEAKKALSVICDVLGYQQTLEVLRTLVPDSSSPAPIINYLPETPPKSFISACHIHLGATDVDVQDFPSICNKLESVGKYIRELEQKVNVVASQPQTESQIFFTSNPFHPPAKIGRGRLLPITSDLVTDGQETASDSDIGSQQEATSTNAPTTPPDFSDDDSEKDAIFDDEDDDDNRDESDPPLEDSTAMSLEIEELKFRLQTQSTEIQRLCDDVVKLQITLVRNEVLGEQCPPDKALLFSRSIDAAYPIPELSDIPQFMVIKVLTLADDFPSSRNKPVGPSLFRWLQSICHAGNYCMSVESPASYRLFLEDSLLWLNSRMHDIVSQGAGSRDGLIQRLIVLLHWVTVEAHPRRVGRVALFMNVGNFTRRTGDMILLHTLLGQLEDGKYDYPFADWTVLDRIAYAHMLAAGPKCELHHPLKMNTEEEEIMYDLVDGLRDRSYADFIRLLESSAVCQYLDREVNGSELVILKTATVDMAVLRTCAADISTTSTEYIWVKRNGHVTMYRNGLDISVDHQYHIRVRPSECSLDSEWAYVDSKLESYVDTYYNDALVHAVDRRTTLEQPVIKIEDDGDEDDMIS